MSRVIIGFGSNVNPNEYLKRAREAFKRDHRLVSESSFEFTAPVGPIEDQPEFLNGAFLVETELDHNSLRQWLKELEFACGRLPSTDRWGPRTLDLDILVWNDEVLDPEIFDRPFLYNSVMQLKPEIFPDRS